MSGNGKDRDLDALKAAVARIRHPYAEKDHLTEASMQCDAIVIALETTANNIMDSAEKIGDLVEEAKRGDERAVENIAELVIDIFENCNFQDLGGQRLTRVMQSLKVVDESIDEALVALDPDSFEKLPVPEMPPSDDDGLLHGPQLAGEGVGQGDIDALFN